MSESVIPVASLIHVIRGQRVMLSTDLARLYGVPAKTLMQAVKRNLGRFPPDFMFQLEWEEVVKTRSQIVTLKRGQNPKYRSYAFTEQGVAMLSSVLRSEQAVQINIAIMRAFVQLRGALAAHRELAKKLSELESRVSRHDEGIEQLFEAIRLLIAPEPAGKKRRYGFEVRERRARYVTRPRTP